MPTLRGNEKPPLSGAWLLSLGNPLALSVGVVDDHRVTRASVCAELNLALQATRVILPDFREPIATALAVRSRGHPIKVDANLQSLLIGFSRALGLDEGSVTNLLGDPEVASRVVLVEFEEFFSSSGHNKNKYAEVSEFFKNYFNYFCAKDS